MTPPQLAFVVPGALDTRTGGSIYNRRIVEGLRSRGQVVSVIEVPGAFPSPTDDGQSSAAEALSALQSGSMVVVDSLVLGSMPDLVVALARRARVVALEHLPLAADPTRTPNERDQFAAGERRALHACAHVVVTGAAALPLLAPFDLPASHVSVVEPGTDRGPLAVPWTDGPVRLLAVGTVNRIKGHDVLLLALARLAHLDWQLTCAGSLERDRRAAIDVRDLAVTLGIGTRVHWVGDLDAAGLDASYQLAHVFVSASRRETYGMAVAEALAHGLPVVATRTGAAPSLVTADAGVLVPVDDPAALEQALVQVLTSADHRSQLARGAARQRERLPSWDTAVSRFIDVLDAIEQMTSR